MECPQCSFDYDPCGGSCKGCPSEHKSHTTFPCNACCRKVTIYDQYGRSGVRGGRYVPRFDFCPNCGASLKPKKKAAEWVKWPSIHDSRWACSGCSHQMGAANAGQLPEECPGCGATMVVSDHDPEPPEEPEPETYDRCERCEPKCDAATPPPAEESTDTTLLPDFPEKKSNIVISTEEPEKGGVYHLICPECGWTCPEDHGGTLKECPRCGGGMDAKPEETEKEGEL